MGINKKNVHSKICLNNRVDFLQSPSFFLDKRHKKLKKLQKILIISVIKKYTS